MNDTQYVKTREKLMALCQELATLDLDGLLGRIEVCEGIGPLVDPTRYRALMSQGGREALARDKRIIHAARALAEAYLPGGTGGPRWEKAVAHARKALKVAEEFPQDTCAYRFMVGTLLRRYESGERSAELLAELEGVE